MSKLMKIGLILLIFLIGQTQSISDEKKAQCQEYIRNYIKQKNLVGVNLGLSENGTITWLEGFGYAQLEPQVPMDPHKTLIRWASMSKQLTAILGAKFRTLGLVDFDQDISEYYKTYVVPSKFSIECRANETTIQYNGTTYKCVKSPSFNKNYALIPIPDQNRKITLRQLLSHYAGIEAYTNGFTNPEPPASQRDDPHINTGIEWALNYFKDFPLINIPDTQYSYTTFGFDLAGEVIAQAHGGRFEDLVLATILENVYTQMPSMVPDKQWLAQFRPQRAKGYYTPGRETTDTDVSYKLPGGGYMSTVEDAIRFCTHLRNNSLLTDDEKLLLWTPPHPEKNTGYGLGFEVYWKDDQIQFVGHSGSQEKARTIMRYYFPQDTGIVLMSNSENFDSYECLTGLMKIIFSPSLVLEL